MTMREHDEQREDITVLEILQRFFSQLTRLWAVVLAVTVLCSAVLAVREKRAFRPWYEASARFSVSSSYDGDDIFSASYYDNAAAPQLAAAFPNILSMDLMKDLMLDRLGKPYINGTIPPYAVANTNMFVLKVDFSYGANYLKMLICLSLLKNVSTKRLHLYQALHL